MVRVISRAFVSLVRMVIPWIIRTLDYLIRVIVTAVSSIWLGIPYTTNRLADIWTKRLVQAGVPTQYEEQMYSFFVGLATAIVITGWVILAFITVGLVGMIF